MKTIIFMVMILSSYDVMAKNAKNKKINPLIDIERDMKEFDCSQDDDYAEKYCKKPSQKENKKSFIDGKRSK
jgi:hypothetical protein